MRTAAAFATVRSIRCFILPRSSWMKPHERSSLRSSGLIPTASFSIRFPRCGCWQATPLSFRRQILALKQYFLSQNCTVLLIDDRTSDGPDSQLAEHRTRRHQPRVRARRIRPPTARVEVVNLRTVDFLSGLHDFNIETGGIVGFPAVSAEKKVDFPTYDLLSGHKDVDALMGGLHCGTSTIMIGPAGVGKSTLTMMYACAAAERGDRVAVYLFDESVETLLKRTGRPRDRYSKAC